MKPILRAAIAGIAGTASVLAVAGCSPAPSEEDVDRTIVIATIHEFSANWDWLQGATVSPSGFQGLVFDSLVYWDVSTRTWEPRLAKELNFSDDRTSIEIVLRDDVDYVDGEHLTADWVKTYLDALLTPEFLGAGSILPYEPVVEVTGEYTLEITTSKPVWLGDFASNLFGFVGIPSPGVLDDPERAAAEPLGSGPYLLEEFNPTTEATFVRNPDYWDPDRYPYDTVIVKVLPDDTARLNALKSGQIDVASIPISAAAEAEANGFTIQSLSSAYNSLIVQDSVESPLEPLRDRRVRQAMMYAFDREAILESVYQGYGEVSLQIFGKDDPSYIEGGDDRYDYDPEKARELLAEAGYPDGFDVTIPVGPATKNIEPVVQQMLADIGIRVTYEEHLEDWVVVGLTGEFPLTLWTEGMNVNATLYQMSVAFPGLGRFFNPNPEIAALAETIKSGTAEDSAEAAQELGELMLDEAWYIPFAHPYALWASSPDVEILKVRASSPPAPEVRDLVPAD